MTMSNLDVSCVLKMINWMKYEYKTVSENRSMRGWKIALQCSWRNWVSIFMINDYFFGYSIAWKYAQVTPKFVKKINFKKFTV